MELTEYFRILRRSWKTIVALSLLGLAAGAAVSLLLKPVYTADTQLFVAIQSARSASELQQGNSFGEARVQSYVKTVTTPMVLLPTIDALGLKTTPDELARNVRASADLNTVLITISVNDGSPERAAAIARVVADNLVKSVTTLEGQGGGDSPVKLTIVRPAAVPASPSAPDKPLNLAVGLMLGLGAGLVVSIARSRLDDRVRSEEDLRRVTDAPILGTIAFDASASNSRLHGLVDTQSGRAESFRLLRTNLQYATVSHDAKTVLVASSLTGEGKTTTAIDLAISMAQTGQSVALVDADLRHPTVAQYLGLERNGGLVAALRGEAEALDLLQPWGDGSLAVLTAGQAPQNPSELLASKAMARLVADLESSFDCVILDSPALAVTDGAILAQLAGGVVLVVNGQKVRREEVTNALGGLRLVSARILGIVLNKVGPRGPEPKVSRAQDVGPDLREDGGPVPQLSSERRLDETGKTGGASSGARSRAH